MFIQFPVIVFFTIKIINHLFSLLLHQINILDKITPTTNISNLITNYKLIGFSRPISHRTLFHGAIIKKFQSSTYKDFLEILFIEIFLNLSINSLSVYFLNKSK